MQLGTQGNRLHWIILPGSSIFIAYYGFPASTKLLLPHYTTSLARPRLTAAVPPRTAASVTLLAYSTLNAQPGLGGVRVEEEAISLPQLQQRSAGPTPRTWPPGTACCLLVVGGGGRGYPWSDERNGYY